MTRREPRTGRSTAASLGPSFATPTSGFTTLPPEDKWVVVRAVAYSGLSNWKEILRKFAMYTPGRIVMIEKYIYGQTPTLPSALAGL